MLFLENNLIKKVLNTKKIYYFMNHRFSIFLEFLIGGIILGIIEDIILIKLLTDEPITFSIFIIIFLVTLPFAFLGEYVVDRIDFLKMFKLNKKYKKLEIFVEFLFFGVLLGVIEDLTAFYFAIGNAITLNVLVVTIIVAIPFAFISEVVFDKINFYLTLKQNKIILKN